MSEKYNQYAHAMQSGVAMDPSPRSFEAKHLRVGVNARAADQAGLVELLISKGVFTAEEYTEAVEKSMKDEVERYEKYLSERLGTKVKLL